MDADALNAIGVAKLYEYWMSPGNGATLLYMVALSSIGIIPKKFYVLLMVGYRSEFRGPISMPE
jgi:hypothetical protein